VSLVRGAPSLLRGRAAGKINLGLAVSGRRPDGFHELASVFLRLALADELTVRAGPRGVSDTLAIRGDPRCPVEGNLVLRAAAGLRRAIPDGSSLPGLAFELEKRIPMGAGLAGGSTDAAAALRLGVAAWRAAARGTDVAAIGVDLAALGARLGADVPFFLSGASAAMVSGVGERIAPLPALLTPVGVLLMTPSFPIATPAAFAAFDRMPPPGPGAAAAVDGLRQAWASGLDGATLAELAHSLRDANDLWAAVVALEPRMEPIRADLGASLGRPVLLTGSGSTLVALYPSLEAARAAASRPSVIETAERAGIRVTVTADGQPRDEDMDP
jgi:4-diphosphocytidyl-2-C-methyl-D-erythritol kinase